MKPVVGKAGLRLPQAAQSVAAGGQGWKCASRSGSASGFPGQQLINFGLLPNSTLSCTMLNACATGWKTGARSYQLVNQALIGFPWEGTLISLSSTRVVPFLGVLVMIQAGDGDRDAPSLAAALHKKFRDILILVLGRGKKKEKFLLTLL